MRFPSWLIASATIVPILVAHAQAELPPGVEKRTETKVLEGGAALLQTDSPLDAMNVHLVGIHPLKSQPGHQMDAHHFCHQVNEEFAQCVLFDGSDKTANLTGIEYIISERLFAQLPPEERQYWHPHNYEIVSGTLVAPNIPAMAEKRLMKGKMNSYGKTWHTWQAKGGNHAPDELPLGEPELAWSLNRDGEADPELMQRREENLGISHSKVREGRAELRPLAKPQAGVDLLKGKFGRETTPIDGVEAAAE